MGQLVMCLPAFVRSESSANGSNQYSLGITPTDQYVIYTHAVIGNMLHCGVTLGYGVPSSSSPMSCPIYSRFDTNTVWVLGMYIHT